MIPFVVVGGLLIAASLALGGETTSEGIVIPDGSFWKAVNDIGTVGFELMIPILAGYIAYAIADRPALAPGMVGGWVAAHGELYGSEAGAGFIGAIVAGFLAGYLVLWIKRVRVPRFVQPIMHVIVIPILATTALGLFLVHVLGRPIAWVFEHLTDWLGELTGTSAALLGVVLGLMISFDMGGPVNKTAFLFGAGLVAENPEIMGMCAAAIPVPPLGQGLATLVRRRLHDGQERETGLAALSMGFFGITEGAIPFAAARPARVIQANMLGGAAAGAVAGLATVTDAVPHGGPIVAAFGAVGDAPMFLVAVAIGTVVTALTTVALLSLEAGGTGGGYGGCDRRAARGGCGWCGARGAGGQAYDGGAGRGSAYGALLGRGRPYGVSIGTRRRSRARARTRSCRGGGGRAGAVRVAGQRGGRARGDGSGRGDPRVGGAGGAERAGRRRGRAGAGRVGAGGTGDDRARRGGRRSACEDRRGDRTRGRLRALGRGHRVRLARRHPGPADLHDRRARGRRGRRAPAHPRAVGAGAH